MEQEKSNQTDTIEMLESYSRAVRSIVDSNRVTLSREEYVYDVLVDVARFYNHVVIDNGVEFEVIAVGFPCDLFYKYYNPSVKYDTSLDTRVDIMVVTIKDYLSKSFDNVSKYVTLFCGQELKSAGIIPQCYLQRRLSSTACFKNHPEGATYAIRTAVDALVRRNLLERLTLDESKGEFNTTSKLFRPI